MMLNSIHSRSLEIISSCHVQIACSDIPTHAKVSLIQNSNLKRKRKQRRLPLCQKQNQVQRYSTLECSSLDSKTKSTFSTPTKSPPLLLDLSSMENASYESIKQIFYKKYMSHGYSFFLKAEDKQLSTDYQFFLFSQVNNKNGMTTGKGKVNQQANLNTMNRMDNCVELGCRYCSSQENGVFFQAVDIKDLQSSCVSSIHNHLLTCTKCPVDVQGALNSLKQNHRHQSSLLKPARQNGFYKRLWERLTNPNYGGERRQTADLVCEILLNILLRVSHIS